MVLVFILLCTIVGIILLIAFSTIKIKIQDLKVDNVTNALNKVSVDYIIILSLNLFDRVKYISIKLNKSKIKKLYSKAKINNRFKNLEKDLKLKDLKYVEIIKPQIDYLKFSAQIGFEDTILTTFVIFFISTLISILLPYSIKKFDKNKYYYQILPYYENKNIYKIKLDCIIQIKMVHIISMIYVFLKKRRVDNNERGTSNRRPYAYSYE